MVEGEPSAHSSLALGPPSPGTVFREGFVASTHFFLSKWVGNNANARKFLLCQGKGYRLIQSKSMLAKHACAPHAAGTGNV